MIHLPALPGAPRSSQTLDDLIAFAVDEAAKLEGAGIDGVIVENVGDTPFFREGVPAITVAAMGVIVREVVRSAHVPVGVNMLRNAWEEAVSVAYITGAQFIRCNVVIGAYVTDQGIIQGCAAELARLRRSLDRDVLVLGDVHVKHAAPPVRCSAGRRGPGSRRARRRRCGHRLGSAQPGSAVVRDGLVSGCCDRLCRS